MTLGAGRVTVPPEAPNRRLRALVVGAGYRARNAFLPALSCLDRYIDVVGIHSRNIAHARRAGEPWGVEAIEDLRALRPGDVDLVLVSVTVTNNLDVLRGAAHLAPGAALVMDTPGLGRLGDLAHLALYRRWAQVRVAEDFMRVPQYRLVAAALASGVIGDISAIRLTRMGYRYHALALLRSWLAFRQPLSARSRPASEGGVDISYRFGGGVIGEVIEPYRQAKGSFDIVGARGSLCGDPMGHPVGFADVGEPCGRLERLENADGLFGFQIVGLDGPISITVPNLTRLRAMGLEDDSEFNLLRVDGLCHVISSLWEPDSVNGRYRLEDGMADLLVSSAARRSRWLAIPQLAKHNLVDLVDTVVRPFGAMVA
jgi:hypothetical protein